MQELIAAANTTGMLQGKVVGVRALTEWTLLVITAIERQGEKNIVKADYLDSLNREEAELECFSSEPIFEVGDFISKSGNKISFLHKKTLATAVFSVGQHVTLPMTEEAPHKSPTSPRSQLIKKRIECTPKRNVFQTPYKIEKTEMKHFKSTAAPIDRFCAKLAPVIKDLAREGTRKPRDVALRLNHLGYKTSCGDKWTPRLTYLLLGVIFNSRAGTR